ncbi:MYCBP-associated protein-like [Rhinatrema bivittatum]|uniref:MYCBP-associated protein-like n=1 Tax=Rhinatrema bivittatum TaxID=194408 RepID=UPI00112A94D1|nr:MYCBP-associated protein-like [Rhinatrema bivittatum]
MFRSMMGIPEKEFALEGTADSKRVVKGRKEEKKLTSVAEEKKVTGGKEKEERKASKTVGKEKAADKEERPSSKKGRKASKFLSQGKGLSGSRESIDLFTSDSRVNPIIMEKYQESLYTEVYGLLVAVVENFVFLSEELKSKTVQEQEEEEYKHFVEASDCWLIRIE